MYPVGRLGILSHCMLCLELLGLEGTVHGGGVGSVRLWTCGSLASKRPVLSVKHHGYTTDLRDPTYLAQASFCQIRFGVGLP